jgi:superfamily I DNA/RNA helicase
LKTVSSRSACLSGDRRPAFYERQEIRDAIAYMRLIAQGDDDLAFERIVNKPKRGIGDASVASLHAYARARQMPLLPAAREIADTDELPPKARKALSELAGNFARWSDTAKVLAAHRTGRNGAGRKRLYRHAEGRQIGGSAGPSGQFERIRPLDGGF